MKPDHTYTPRGSRMLGAIVVFVGGVLVGAGVVGRKWWIVVGGLMAIVLGWFTP